jgi:hypothetical protein
MNKDKAEIRKFLIRIFIFGMILASLLILKKSMTPYYLGNSDYRVKLDYSKRSQQKFNTVVFGSSRLFRHVHSALLDSLLSEKQLNTFNFASAATYNPEAYYLYENYIEDAQKNEIKYAFIELQNLYEITKENQKSTKATYWNNFRYLLFSYRYILNTHYGYLKKSKFIWDYTLSFIYGHLDFQILKHFFKPADKATIRKIGIQGFYTLDQNLADTKQNDYYKKIKTSFLADTMVLQERMKGVKEAKKVSTTTPVNQFHLDFLLALIDNSKQKGIEVIFILPPKLKDIQYIELLPVANALPAKHIIRLEDPDKYKEFYLTKYAFDVAHLNALGANLFTNYVAMEFKKRYF